MSENKLSLDIRTLTGKKLARLRREGKIPSVIYGEGEAILAQSEYIKTEKVLEKAGYHSTIDLDIDNQKKLAIVKDIMRDPVSRKIINIEFQTVAKNQKIVAITPIIIENFETSEASKNHIMFTQVMDSIEVKAKPSDLPKEFVIDASKMVNLDDKILVSDLVLPKNVELANKEMSQDQIIASLYDPSAEAAAREKENTEEQTDAVDVPSDNGSKPEEKAE